MMMMMICPTRPDDKGNISAYRMMPIHFVTLLHSVYNRHEKNNNNIDQDHQEDIKFTSSQTKSDTHARFV